jgi:magnesium chelatase family protein
MYSSVKTAAYIGLHGYIVDVEVHIANGLPRFKIVGLPDKSVEEAKERVTAAIKSAGYTFPLKRITVNLSPTDIPKHGSSFDLPILLGILSASGQIPHIAAKKSTLIFGEVGLDGSLRETPGTPILADAAVNTEIPEIICPVLTEPLHTYFPGIRIRQFSSLKECTSFITDPTGSSEASAKTTTQTKKRLKNPPAESTAFQKISGNPGAKRALLLSAAGWHHLCMSGPPGCGKTLYAHALVDLLPEQDLRERITLLKAYHLQSIQLPRHRPFREPHHSISPAAMFGGAIPTTPGEISLSHKGVLLMDEFPYFRKEILLGLRSVLDNRYFKMHRHGRTIRFPADFLLVTTMNNCPCGYLGHPVRKCSCSFPNIKRYKTKIPGSLSDRIDIHLAVSNPDTIYGQVKRSESSMSELNTCRELVRRTRDRQKMRGVRNSTISFRSLPQTCPLTPEGKAMLTDITKSLGLSMRSHLKIVRIARTIADIEDAHEISDIHIAEAASYREKQL